MSEEEDLRRFYSALMEVMFSRSTAATNIIINKVRPRTPTARQRAAAIVQGLKGGAVFIA